MKDQIPSKAEIKDLMLSNISRYQEETPDGDAHDIRKVAPDLNTSLNTINLVITAVQSGGKTFYIMNEVIPLSHLPSVHLVLFVGRKERDPTLKASAPLLGCTIKFTDYESATEEIMEILEAKRCYSYLREQLEGAGRLEDWASCFPDEEMEKLEDKVFDELEIHDFSRPFLDTIIIFDDAGSTKLFRANTYIAEHLSIVRDDLTTYFIATHEISDLDPKIKSKAKTITLLKGISRERLVVIRREIAVPISWEEFIDIYTQFSAGSNRYLVIDNQEGTITEQN
jgi:hypothetical protein